MYIINIMMIYIYIHIIQYSRTSWSISKTVYRRAARMVTLNLKKGSQARMSSWEQQRMRYRNHRSSCAFWGNSCKILHDLSCCVFHRFAFIASCLEVSPNVHEVCIISGWMFSLYKWFVLVMWPVDSQKHLFFLPRLPLLWYMSSKDAKATDHPVHHLASPGCRWGGFCTACKVKSVTD